MADEPEVNQLAKKLAPLLKRLEEELAVIHDTQREIAQLVASDNPVLALSLFWAQQWQAKNRAAYVWNHARDKPQIKRLLKTISADDLKARMIAYLSSDDPFHARNQHNFGIFVSAINSFAGSKPRQRVLGCHHEPPCADDVEHTRRRRT